MMERELIQNYVFRWLVENKRRLVQTAIISGLFILILGLARFANQTSLLLVLGMVAGLVGILILLRWPPLGVAALIAGSLVSPLRVNTGSQSPLNATVLILVLLFGLWVFDRIARKERLIEVVSRTYLSLILFSVVAILAFGIGQLPWFTFARPAPIRAQVGGLMIFLFSFGAFMLVGQQLRSERWLQALTWIFILLAGVYVASRMTPVIRPFTNRFYANNGGGSLFWTWLVALSLPQALFNRKLHMRWRLLAGGIAMATLYVGFFVVRAWTSGWLPAMVAMVVVLWFGAPRLGLVATIVGAILMVIKATEVTNVVMVGDNQYSLMTRLEAWKIVLGMIEINPILGLGPANYYRYTHLYPILGYAVSFNSHNNYIDIIAQTGILGLICFLWFAVEAGWLGLRLSLRIPEGFGKAYVYGCMGGLAGTLVAAMLGDWVIPFAYNVGLGGLRASIFAWIFLGGLVTLERNASSAQG
jgi:O-antigen ligase